MTVWLKDKLSGKTTALDVQGAFAKTQYKKGECFHLWKKKGQETQELFKMLLSHVKRKLERKKSSIRTSAGHFCEG